MKGTVVHVREYFSDAHQRRYFTVYIKLENGSNTMTYLDPQNRNWKNWQGMMAKGTRLDNLIVMPNGKIDADSIPIKIEPPPDPQLTLL